MLGILAAIVFAVAFVIAATTTATNAVFAPGTLLLLGLALLALHMTEIGASWGIPAYRRRRR